MSERIGHGVYGLGEAAKLTGVNPATLRSWFFSTEKKRRPVLQADYPAVKGSYAVSFLDLVDARVASELRTLGLSMQQVRRLYVELREIVRSEHPFASGELLHDGTTD